MVIIDWLTSHYNTPWSETYYMHSSKAIDSYNHIFLLFYLLKHVLNSFKRNPHSFVFLHLFIFRVRMNALKNEQQILCNQLIMSYYTINIEGRFFYSLFVVKYFLPTGGGNEHKYLFCHIQLIVESWYRVETWCHMYIDGTKWRFSTLIYRFFVPYCTKTRYHEHLHKQIKSKSNSFLGEIIRLA